MSGKLQIRLPGAFIAIQGHRNVKKCGGYNLLPSLNEDKSVGIRSGLVLTSSYVPATLLFYSTPEAVGGQ